MTLGPALDHRSRAAAKLARQDCLIGRRGESMARRGALPRNLIPTVIIMP
jgi:hypothetical protein